MSSNILSIQQVYRLSNSQCWSFLVGGYVWQNSGRVNCSWVMVCYELLNIYDVMVCLRVLWSRNGVVWAGEWECDAMVCVHELQLSNGVVWVWTCRWYDDVCAWTVVDQFCGLRLVYYGDYVFGYTLVVRCCVCHCNCSMVHCWLLAIR